MDSRLTNRANLIDKQIALLPDMRLTWSKTREAAQTSDTPPEIRQQIDNVLAGIAQAESALQKPRAAILTEQSRVAEQSRRVAGALASIRTAQNASVSQLFVRDSAPAWSPEVRSNAARDLVEGIQKSFNAQSFQLRTYLATNWPQFIYLGLVFCGLAIALFWVKHRAAKWTDDDPLLERANRVLQLPIATAAVLTLLVCRPLFEEAPRVFWAAVAAVTLLPIVLILRRLLDRLLFPILNALVVFYVIAQLRRLAASLPGLSRLVLLLEMVGGAIFLLWFIRSTRLPALATSTTSHKATRAGARNRLTPVCGGLPRSRARLFPVGELSGQRSARLCLPRRFLLRRRRGGGGPDLFCAPHPPALRPGGGAAVSANAPKPACPRRFFYRLRDLGHHESRRVLAPRAAVRPAHFMGGGGVEFSVPPHLVRGDSRLRLHDLGGSPAFALHPLPPRGGYLRPVSF